MRYTTILLLIISSFAYGQEQSVIEIVPKNIQINGLKYIEMSKNGRLYLLKSVNGDTIIKAEDFYFNYELLDFNDDGYTDIRVFIFSNSANQCDNYVYRSTSKSFELIENCNSNFKKLPGVDFYYTYYKSGCAGQDFVSYLSQGLDFVDVGFIEENGCEGDTINYPQNYKVYKIIPNVEHSRVLLESFSYDDFMGIEEYWIKNYKNFINKT